MLVIRMQRTGRKGHAQFRVVVQDSRRTPTSGKVVAQIGTYDPHSKETKLDKAKAQHYLEHGAQPSPRAVVVLKSEGIAMPAWVKDASQKTGTIRHSDKLRRHQPKEEVVEEAPAEPAVEEPEVPAKADSEETPAAAEEPAEPEADAPAEADETEAPAEK